MKPNLKSVNHFKNHTILNYPSKLVLVWAIYHNAELGLFISICPLTIPFPNYASSDLLRGKKWQKKKKRFYIVFSSVKNLEKP